MALKYRVSLPGIKGFARVYELKESTSLYAFSNRMKFDMNFPQDQMVMFKAFTDDGKVSARYAPFDLGAGTIDEVTMAATLKKGEKSFNFFYDTTNAKSVIVSYEGTVPTKPGASYPLLVETKGPDPVEFENGYVAFEDLPDDKRKLPEDDGDWDDDFDEDEKDDGDEDGSEIYDESEDAE